MTAVTPVYSFFIGESVTAVTLCKIDFVQLKGCFISLITVTIEYALLNHLIVTAVTPTRIRHF